MLQYQMEFSCGRGNKISCLLENNHYCKFWQKVDNLPRLHENLKLLNIFDCLRCVALKYLGATIFQ